MLVLKSLDINLLKREKTTLFSFLALYSFLTIIIISIVSFLYYDFKKEIMLQEKRELLHSYSNDLAMILKYMHINFDTQRYYPRDGRFNSAIYDSDKQQIFSLLKNKRIEFDKVSYIADDKIHYIARPESHYLGTKYMIIEIDDDKLWLIDLKQNIMIYGFLAFLFMFGIGYFLLNLFLRPLKDALMLLDRFIKDTTHELNTPVSTIVTNMEMIDTDTIDEKTAKKIKRIDIGAKTISNIYQDLTYLTLNNKIISQDESLDIAKTAQQRVEYFKTIAQGKMVDIRLEINDHPVLVIDKNKFSKLLDNLISNAIKYNKIKGTIRVSVNSNNITVQDTGIGIEKEKISRMFERYTRFNKSAGGFGIGLSIVSIICDEYNLDINIESELKKGTKVTVSW
ncbi:MAG: HAMP domain-containing sensor histidine kinase [Campylobacterota bacterium]|nr:HAMP domain-containing sensor histidine kinase [Campylobacterota bacterium]